MTDTYEDERDDDRDDDLFDEVGGTGVDDEEEHEGGFDQGLDRDE
jgi:hypothetical protein